MELKERRRFRRWDVFIPCDIDWEGRAIKGLIQNLSQGGALITKVNTVPPQDAEVTIMFEVKKEKVELEARLTSRVVHTSPESKKLGQIGWFGVEFQGPAQEIESKIVPLLRTVASGEFPVQGESSSG